MPVWKTVYASKKNYNKKLMKNSRQEYNTIDEYILTFPKAVQKLLEGKEQ